MIANGIWRSQAAEQLRHESFIDQEGTLQLNKKGHYNAFESAEYRLVSR